MNDIYLQILEVGGYSLAVSYTHLLLTLGKPHLEQDAMRALDWALGALPGEA